MVEYFAFWCILLLLRPIACTVNDTVDVAPKCFRQDPSEPTLGRPDPLVCLNIATDILSGEKAEAPVEFSRNPRAGFQLPHDYRPPGGGCFVYVDFLPDARKEARFAVAEFARAIFDLTSTCVTNPQSPRLGGRIEVGPKLRVFVAVADKPLTHQSTLNWTDIDSEASAGRLDINAQDGSSYLNSSDAISTEKRGATGHEALL